jgi:Resolvase, N terminal domain/Helix-turn-helix domain
VARVHAGGEERVALQVHGLAVVNGRNAHVADEHVRKTPRSVVAARWHDPTGFVAQFRPGLKGRAGPGRGGGEKQVFGDAWADTTTSHGRLMLTVLGGLAEFERDLIRARTSEGRERAKGRGVKMGRKPKLTPHQQREAIKRRDVDGEPIRDIARSYNVHNSTISRLNA